MANQEGIPGLETDLEHGVWLKRLALSLVGDESTASDIVGEAYQTLGRQKPGVVQNARGFLSAAVHHLVRRRHRAEDRRRHREQAVARPESLPSTLDLTMQLETQRLLLQELESMQGVNRETIFLRYYHGLSCAEIARRQGLAPDVVRKRLQRGLGELRARLDEKFPDREAWQSSLGSFLACTGEWGVQPLIPSGHFSSILAGTVCMSTIVKLASVAVIGATMLWWGNGRQWTSADAPDLLRDQALQQSPVASSQGAALSGELSLGLGMAETVTITKRDALDRVFALESNTLQDYRLRLWSAFNAPLANTKVVSMDRDQRCMNLTTDAKGWLVLEASGEELDLVIFAHKSYPHALRVTLNPGEFERRIPRGARLAGQIRVNGQIPERRIRVGITSDHALLAGTDQDDLIARHFGAMRSLTQSGPMALVQVETDARGNLELGGLPNDWSGSLVFPSEYKLGDARRGGVTRVLRKKHMDAPAEGWEIDLNALLRVTGRIVESGGQQPVPRSFGWYEFRYDSGGSGISSFQADEQGVFVFGLKEEELRVLRITYARKDGTGQTEFEATKALEAGFDLGDLPLAQERSLRFVVKNQQGQPIEGARGMVGVGFFCSPPTDMEGRSSLPAVPVEAEMLHVTALGYGIEAVPLVEGQSEFNVVLKPTRQIKLHVLQADGVEANAIQVMLLTKDHTRFDAFRTELDLLSDQLLGDWTFSGGEADGRASYHFRTDEKGQLEIQNPPHANFEFYVLSSAREILARRKVGPLDSEAKVSLEMKLPIEVGSLRGRVQDPSGKPLAGVSISLVSAQAMQPGRYGFGPPQSR